MGWLTRLSLNGFWLCSNAPRETQGSCLASLGINQWARSLCASSILDLSALSDSPVPAGGSGRSTAGSVGAARVSWFLGSGFCSHLRFRGREKLDEARSNQPTSFCLGFPNYPSASQEGGERTKASFDTHFRPLPFSELDCF